MTRDSIRKWMKQNGISIHRLAKYIGVSVAYFNCVLNGREALTDKTKMKIELAMRQADLSSIKDMAYLQVPFTRADWKNIKAIFGDEQFLADQVRNLVLKAVEHIAEEQSSYLPGLYEDIRPKED